MHGDHGQYSVIWTFENTRKLSLGYSYRVSIMQILFQNALGGLEFTISYGYSSGNA